MTHQEEPLFTEDGEPKVKKEERLLGALAYAPLLFLLPHFLGTKTPFVTFHVKQGMFLNVVFLLLPALFFGFFIWGILFLVYAGFGVYAGMKAFDGESVEY